MVEKYECTGCGACHDSCPVNAIEMRPDKEGFLYPIINFERCISCGVCERVCPVGKTYDEQKNRPTVYAGRAKDKSIQMHSASGGIFPLIAKHIIQQSGFVWGASFNDDYNVCHTFATNESELGQLCRSKYVQSDLYGAYKNIKEQLKEGRLVLFTGTPCQTSALASFIGNDLRKNLILVDVVCHGVPSPMIWREFLKELSDSQSEDSRNISSISFKYKDSVRKWIHPGFRVVWRSGKEYLDYSNMSWYENGYLGNLYVRPACHSCRFKGLNSPSDLTIGDFWGCAEVMPEMYDEDGVSVLFSKTEKGAALLLAIQSDMKYKEITLEEAIEHNARIVEPTAMNKNSIKFWKYYYTQSEKNLENMGHIVQVCTRTGYYELLRCKIARLRRALGRIKR